MGSRDASFQTASCIAKMADIVQEELPEVSKTLREIYVDDGNTFSDTAAKCNKTLKDTIKVLEEYNFRVHKIISDNQEVLKDIPIEKLSKDTKFVKHSKEFAQTSQKETLAIKTSKCLGVHFQIDHDENKSFISYSHWPKLAEPVAITKREISRLLSSLWDPLGLWSPAIIKGKLCLSEVYKISKELKLFEKDMKSLNEKTKPLSILWDTDLRELKLPNSQLQERLDKLLRDWEDFKSDILNFKDIRVNRYMFDQIPENLGKPIKVELFVFSDSSGKMICTAAYIRLTFECDGNIRRLHLWRWPRVEPNLKQ